MATELPLGARLIDGTARHVVIDGPRVSALSEPFVITTLGIDLVGSCPSPEAQDANRRIQRAAELDPTLENVRVAGLHTISTYFGAVAGEAAAGLPRESLAALFIAVGRWLQRHGLEVIAATMASSTGTATPSDHPQEA